jgi:hypothetical protein
VTVNLTPPRARPVPPDVLERQRATLRRAIASPRSSGLKTPRLAIAFAGAALVGLAAATLAYSGAFSSALGVLRPNPKSPTTIANDLRSDWEADLQHAASATPEVVFPNLPAAQLRARLEEASSRYGFRIREIRILRPRQDAPAIVVQAQDPAALVPRLPALLRVLDPKQPGDDAQGWAYEGFFLEVVDGGGQPAVVVTNAWRPPNAGGTQWAAPGYELPFEHG